MIKLSTIPSWFLMGSEKLKNYLEQRNVTTLVNDYGSGLEYDVEEIEESYDYFLSVLAFKSAIKQL